MMTLTEFLLARIAEDEKAARGLSTWGVALDVDINLEPWDSARVLAECEAKRRIVEECGHTLDRLTYSGDLARAALGHMAAIYADHPDFREEWRP